jgi:hypothetical protein
MSLARNGMMFMENGFTHISLEVEAWDHQQATRINEL